MAAKIFFLYLYTTITSIIKYNTNKFTKKLSDKKGKIETIIVIQLLLISIP